MRKCLFCWLETVFNESSHVKQPSITTVFNSSGLHREFVYNNAPYGIVQLGLSHSGGRRNKIRRERRVEFHEPVNTLNLLNKERA